MKPHALRFRFPLAAALAIGFAVSPALLSAEAPAPAEGEHTVATKRGPCEVVPLHHATFALRWNGKTIYVDPTGGEERFADLPSPTLVLVTDIHGDHLDPDTVKAVRTDATTVVAPPKAAEQLEEAGIDEGAVRSLENGERTGLDGIGIEAIPMYNLTEERKDFHPKGRGNGYVLDLAGTRVYISGDTEDIPEMRALEDIQLAFVCMNLPYTMTVEQAASAVLEFEPAVVYPYHYRGRDGGTQDPERFRSLVRQGSDAIEVRLHDWYADEQTGEEDG